MIAQPAVTQSISNMTVDELHDTIELYVDADDEQIF